MSEFTYCPRCRARLVERSLDDRARHVCAEGCGFVHYDNPTPVVAAVVEHEGLVVLARNRAWPDSWYGLITGFLERGESPEAGVAREVGEELGLDAGGTRLIGAYPFERMNQVILAYHVPASGTITLGHELVDYRRIEPERCQVWPSGTGYALRDWLRTRGIEPPVIDRTR